MNVLAMIVGVSVLFAFCEGCDYEDKMCTQFAALGDDFTVYFERLNGCCSHEKQIITGATIQVVNNSTKMDVPFNSTTFWAPFTNENTTNGSHWYILAYTYRCNHRSRAICSKCSCVQENILLHLRIAAFNLTKDIAQPMEGENVEMLSTSGLTTNNVEVKFTFSPIGKENIKVAECPPIMRKPHKVKPNWVITRLDNNCQLLVMDVTSADDGSYEAVGLLPSGDVGGKYVYAYSNSVQMRVGSETTLGPASIESKSSILGYAVALAVTLVCIVVAVVAIFFLVRRYPCIGPLPVPPVPAPPPDIQPRPRYGSTDPRQPQPPPVAGDGNANTNPPICAGALGNASSGSPGTGVPGYVPPNPRGTPRCLSPQPPVSGVAASAGGRVRSEEERFADSPASDGTVVPFGERTPLFSPTPGNAYEPSQPEDLLITETAAANPVVPLQPSKLSPHPHPDGHSGDEGKHGEATSPASSGFRSLSPDSVVPPQPSEVSPHPLPGRHSGDKGQLTALVAASQTSLSSGFHSPSPVGSEHSSSSGGSDQQVEESHDRASGLKSYATEPGSSSMSIHTSGPGAILVRSSPAVAMDVPTTSQSQPPLGIPSETSSKSSGRNSPVKSKHSSGCE